MNALFSEKTPSKVIACTTKPKLSVEAERTNLILVSNSRLLHEGLNALVGTYQDLNLISYYPAQFPKTMPLPEALQPLVLLDCTIGHELTLSWLRNYRNLIPVVKAIIIEMIPDPALILTYVEAGINAYTLQGASFSELVAVIKQVQQGHTSCSPEITTHLFQRLANYSANKAGNLRAEAENMPLTPRELEILRYIADDYTNQKIASTLVIEVRTVKQHVHNILEKLRLRNRLDAARFAAAQGWLDA